MVDRWGILCDCAGVVSTYQRPVYPWATPRQSTWVSRRAYKSVAHTTVAQTGKARSTREQRASRRPSFVSASWLCVCVCMCVVVCGGGGREKGQKEGELVVA